MKIVSFDVGRKNLACCIHDSNTNLITFWYIFDIGENKGTKLIYNAFAELDKFPILLTGDIVLVERQPNCNPTMRVIEAIVESYFVGKGLATMDYSSRFKLNNADLSSLGNLKGKSNYAVRKKAAIGLCRLHLTNHPQPETVVKIWDTCKKKDDLADCLLQALSYTDYKGTAPSTLVLTEPPPWLPTREPRDKNLSKGKIFTRCQVKWLLVDWFGRLLDTEDNILAKIKLHPRVLRSVNSHWRKDLSLCLLQLKQERLSKVC
jgi:hypothetical protein